MDANAKLFELTPLLSGPRYPISSASASGRRLFVGSEDGALRVYECRDPPLSTPRPAFDLVDTVSRFSKKREPLQGLHAAPRWRALLCMAGAFSDWPPFFPAPPAMLFSTPPPLVHLFLNTAPPQYNIHSSDGGITVHPLATPSKPGFSLPGSEGCRGFVASPGSGLVCVLQRSRVLVFAWVGAVSDEEGGLEGPTPEAHHFRRVAVYNVSTSPAAGAKAQSTCSITGGVCVGGGQVCLSVVHGVGGTPVLSGGEGDEGVGEGAVVHPPTVDLVGAFLPHSGVGSGEGASATSSSSSSSSTPATPTHTFSHELTYILFHAWTGVAAPPPPAPRTRSALLHDVASSASNTRGTPNFSLPSPPAPGGAAVSTTTCSNPLSSAHPTAASAWP